MRKLGITVAIIFGVIIVGAVATTVLFDPNHYRGAIQADLEKRLGRTVMLGDMHLGLLPPRLRVRDLAIGDDPTFHDQKLFVQARDVDVSVRLLSLLKGAIDIDSLSLQSPSIEVVKNQQGVWNFSSLGTNSKSSGTGIGGYMNTALSNNACVYSMKLKGLVPNLNNPSDAVIGVLGMLGKKRVNRTQPSQQQQQNPNL